MVINSENFSVCRVVKFGGRVHMEKVCAATM